VNWPENITRIDHVPPGDHAAFYASLGWALNVTRADMRRHGYSPSVRLFEAGACEVPIISDEWPGLAQLFAPGREILIARDTQAVLAILEMPETARLAIATAGHRRTMAEHTASARAKAFDTFLAEARVRRDHCLKPETIETEGVRA
jgi:spore maturation protein CgeB